MARKIVSLLLIGVLLVSAGCSGLGIFGEDMGNTTTTTDSYSPTPAPSNETDPTYGMNTNTGEIVLRLSDLPSGYEFRGEVNKSPSENLSKKGITKIHKRSFSYNSTNKSGYPSIIISSTIIYENQHTASGKFQETVENLLANNASVETEEIISGSTATIAKFSNQRGGKVTLIYSQKENMGFYVVSLTKSSYQTDQTKEFYIKMLVDL